MQVRNVLCRSLGCLKTLHSAVCHGKAGIKLCISKIKLKLISSHKIRTYIEVFVPFDCESTFVSLEVAKKSNLLHFHLSMISESRLNLSDLLACKWWVLILILRAFFHFMLCLLRKFSLLLSLQAELYCPKCLLRNLPTKIRNYRIAPLWLWQILLNPL